MRLIQQNAAGELDVPHIPQQRSDKHVQKQAQQHHNQQDLSEEDKKILEDAHKNRENPDHPAHKDYPEYGKFLKSVPKRLGGAAIFGAGASAGSAAFHSVAG